MARNRKKGGVSTSPPPTDSVVKIFTNNVEPTMEDDESEPIAAVLIDEQEEDSESRFNREVGERLRHLREVLGMTLTDVARKLEVTRQTLSNYESGRTPLRASVIRELAEIYEASCDWILGVENDIEIQTNANGRSLYMRERSPQIYPASVKTEDDKHGYDMVLQEKAMEEAQRQFAEYGDQY